MLLRFKRGLSLLEVVWVLLVLVIIISSIVGTYHRRVQQSRMDQTLADMDAIAEAAMNYYHSTGSLPFSLADLIPEYIAQGVRTNAFGYPYSVVSTGGKVSVSSTTPAGLVKPGTGFLLETSPASEGNEVVTITKREEMSTVARLMYDKRNVYHE
jgi:Tfp pilus assembly protein PilE